jgi:CheY-like chemotaxis protein
MQVESVPGEGSTFKVFLPALEAHLVRTESAVAPIDRRSTGTILVVDDEEVVRRLAKAMLEHCGYAVLAAGDGREAVDIFREHASDITAVLLDMTMPVMGGEEALQQIRNIRPNVPIIISSGYSELVAREHFAPSAVTGFIQKPYTVAKLAEQIRTILQD